MAEPETIEYYLKSLAIFNIEAAEFQRMSNLSRKYPKKGLVSRCKIRK